MSPRQSAQARQRLLGLLTTLLLAALLLTALFRLAALLLALLPVLLLVELDGLAAFLVVALASPFLPGFGLESVRPGLRRELTTSRDSFLSIATDVDRLAWSKACTRTLRAAAVIPGM
ncbi:MAG TPA: hypothetical protein VGV13_05180 [Methylomirabilota bacterium]|nr:hypothetical protein [Methylomirabilota bacterium]